MSKKKSGEWSRNYALVVYNLDDIKTIISQKEKIKRYAYILHDKDLLEDGTPKQNHYHLYINFYNVARITWLETLKTKQPFKENALIERCASPEELIIYFTHENEPEKHKYPLTDITSNFDLSKLTNETELQEHLDIFEELEKIAQGKSRMSQLFRRYPKLIYSANSLKTVLQMLSMEIFEDNEKALYQRKRFENAVKQIPKKTKTPFDPKK